MSRRGFFSSLNYTSCNEDWRTEQRALRVGPDDRVLAVAGSGDRPLHLLLQRPRQVTAIDVNACQVNLSRLKAAAISRITEHATYRGFLGLDAMPTARRLSLLDHVLDEQDPELLAFWRARAHLVGRGLLYQGRWERHHRRLGWLARLLRPGAVEALFSFSSLQDQRAFVAARWDKPWWRWCHQLLCSKLAARLALGDPAFYAHVQPGLSVGRYLYSCQRRSLMTHLARDNFMLSLVYRGVLPPGDLPPYLTQQGVDALRPLLPRLSWRQGDLIAHLQARQGRYSRFSFSDVPSYLDAAGFEELLAAMIHAATDGARFCIRQFLSGHEIPARLRSDLLREPGLEQDLEQQDRAFAYRFFVGRIKK